MSAREDFPIGRMQPKVVYTIDPGDWHLMCNELDALRALRQAVLEPPDDCSEAGHGWTSQSPPLDIRRIGLHDGIRAERHRLTRLALDATVPAAGSLSEGPQADGRDASCVANWPECINGQYNPNCCRWPKSCSVQTSVGPQRGETP